MNDQRTQPKSHWDVSVQTTFASSSVILLHQQTQAVKIRKIGINYWIAYQAVFSTVLVQIKGLNAFFLELVTPFVFQ